MTSSRRFLSSPRLSTARARRGAAFARTARAGRVRGAFRVVARRRRDPPAMRFALIGVLPRHVKSKCREGVSRGENAVPGRPPSCGARAAKGAAPLPARPRRCTLLTRPRAGLAGLRPLWRRLHRDLTRLRAGLAGLAGLGARLSLRGAWLTGLRRLSRHLARLGRLP